MVTFYPDLFSFSTSRPTTNLVFSIAEGMLSSTWTAAMFRVSIVLFSNHMMIACLIRIQLSLCLCRGRNYFFPNFNPSNQSLIIEMKAYNCFPNISSFARTNFLLCMTEWYTKLVYMTLMDGRPADRSPHRAMGVWRLIDVSVTGERWGLVLMRVGHRMGSGRKTGCVNAQQWGRGFLPSPRSWGARLCCKEGAVQVPCPFSPCGTYSAGFKRTGLDASGS